MPRPWWFSFLMRGRSGAKAPRAQPLPEYNAWKRDQQRQFIDDEARVRGTVEATTRIVATTKAQSRRAAAPQN